MNYALHFDQAPYLLDTTDNIKLCLILESLDSLGKHVSAPTVLTLTLV